MTFKKLQRTLYEDLLVTQKKMFYKSTKHCAFYQTVIYVDIHNNQRTNLEFLIVYLRKCTYTK